MFNELFEKVYKRQNLTMEESRQAVFQMMDGGWTEAEVSAILTALHSKGESADELAGFALGMRERAVPLPGKAGACMDTCGTGGDRKGSFNISTIAAFVLAGCGIAVAKHGNRAATSLCGSADLLEALGLRARLNPEEATEALDRVGFAFLFAPDYHPATKSVVVIRKRLGTPTIFNLLGPLTNPAFPEAQLIGVYDNGALPRLAAALSAIDPKKRAFLVHSSDGLDEATPSAEFFVYSPDGQKQLQNSVEFGIPSCDLAELKGGTPADNAQIARSILNRVRGPKRDAVLLNALLGYMIYKPDSSPAEALREVQESIDSGAAKDVVQKYKERFPAHE